jgi:hypothetical protein
LDPIGFFVAFFDLGIYESIINKGRKYSASKLLFFPTKRNAEVVIVYRPFVIIA